MKKVSINELKKDFSAWSEKAAQGESIEITKHNKAFVRLVPSRDSSVHVGKFVGKKDLVAIPSLNTHGKSLHFLDEDRDRS